MWGMSSWHIFHSYVTYWKYWHNLPHFLYIYTIHIYILYISIFSVYRLSTALTQRKALVKFLIVAPMSLFTILCNKSNYYINRTFKSKYIYMYLVFIENIVHSRQNAIEQASLINCGKPVWKKQQSCVWCVFWFWILPN